MHFAATLVQGVGLVASMPHMRREKIEYNLQGSCEHEDDEIKSVKEIKALGGQRHLYVLSACSLYETALKCKKLSDPTRSRATSRTRAIRYGVLGSW